MRRGIRIPAWYLLVAVLGILSCCQSLQDLERFAICHHSLLSEALGLFFFLACPQPSLP